MENQQKKQNYKKEDLKWLFILFYIILLVCFYFIHLKRKQIKETAGLKFNSVNMEIVSDGSYEGKTKTSFMTVEVGVTVENHKIIKIDVLQNQGSVKFDPSELIIRIIEENKSIVAVSKGYELQSIVFFNAVDKALYSAVNPENTEQTQESQ